MKWDDSLSVGCDIIDDQHKELITLVDELETSLKTGLKKQQIAHALQFIVNYTRYHFSAEEDLMKLIGFSELSRHKEIHDNLIQKVTDILIQMKEGKSLDAPALVEFFIDWVKDHVSTEDQKIGTFWRTQSSGANAADCRIKGALSRRSGITPKLDKLKELFSTQSIGIDDFKIRQLSLFESIFIELGPDKIADGLSDLDHFVRQGTINSKERIAVLESYLSRIDLDREIDEIQAVEEKLALARLFREFDIISEEKFNELKTKILNVI